MCYDELLGVSRGGKISAHDLIRILIFSQPEPGSHIVDSFSQAVPQQKVVGISQLTRPRRMEVVVRRLASHVKIR